MLRREDAQAPSCAKPAQKRGKAPTALRRVGAQAKGRAGVKMRRLRPAQSPLKSAGRCSGAKPAQERGKTLSERYSTAIEQLVALPPMLALGTDRQAAKPRRITAVGKRP
ncbi:MAG: hypothetical protein IJS15_07630 [Victivallales bacterium]|nr:hypothetical protein [Victivallales bacterium]